MTFNEEVLYLYNKIINFKPGENNTLPENTFFLDDDLILCKDRKYGDSRTPYTNDGLTLWAHASGNLSVNETTFFIFNPTLEGKQPSVTFFGGVKNEKDEYDFVSITGNADTILSYDAPKYVIFSTTSAYYIRIFNNVLFALKTGIDKNKNILFSLSAISLTKENKDIYIASYFNPLFLHADNDCEETKWFKKCTLNEQGASFLAIEDLSRSIHLFNYGVFHRGVSEYSNISSTTSRQIFASKKHNHITLSEGLRKGYFAEQKDVTLFSDTSIFSDIVTNSIKEDERFNVSYTVYRLNSEEECLKKEKEKYSLLNNELAFKALEDDPSLKKVNNLKIEFGPFNNLNINNELFNSFIHSTIKQVDYCAKAKNSSLSLLGVRDVFQMIEASLIWDKEFARAKILNALNFIDESGKATRQYANPTSGDTFSSDNREFIDQNQWIISTIHTYLAFTNDLSILDEKCRYCKLNVRADGTFTDKSDTVLDHLFTIVKYLLSHVDEKTKCLHTLYGDWNDAVDGLGTTSNPNKKFGDGVSAMATFHLVKNLNEMKNIIALTDRTDPFNIDKWLKDIKDGIQKHLIVTNGEEKRIIHGWGEGKEFLVGSFNDVDGKDRYSLTSSAFYVISGLLNEHPELKQTILDSYSHLNSKYGYLTFTPYFARGEAEKVGRIVNLPNGTAENAATYIHSAIFAIRSLFQMNENEEAFKQLHKVLPITHDTLTHSPYVMPNSYIYNEEIDVDGESMNDWYTGSSNTIIKALVFDLFGINPLPGNKISFKPITTFPSNDAKIELDIKGKHFTIVYKKEDDKERFITLNGKIIDNEFDIDECLENNLIIITN